MSSNKANIRKATPDDVPAITAIYADAVTHGKASFELTPPDETEMLARFNKLDQTRYPYWVATINDRIVGYAYAGPYRERPGYQWTVENSIYVDPACHGMGIGSMLLRQIIKECTSNEFRQMMAIIGDSSNLGSIRLHERHGFRHVGTMRSVGRKLGQWLDVVIMQKKLGDGDCQPPIDGT